MTMLPEKFNTDLKVCSVLQYKEERLDKEVQYDELCRNIYYSKVGLFLSPKKIFIGSPQSDSSILGVNI